MNTIESIFRRRSVRKYDMIPLSQDELEKIKNLSESLEVLDRSIDFNIHIIESGSKITNLFSGIVSNYTKVVAPHYMLITSELKDGYLENVGFSLESLVLALTDMNIGSCWIGGFNKKADLENIVPMKATEVPVILIAFGKAKAASELSTKIAADFKRKKLSDIFIGKLDDEKSLIWQSVQRAPSGINGQPWRFFLTDSGATLYTVKQPFLLKSFETMNRIDAGIALMHFKIAAETLNLSLSISNDTEISKNGYNYIASIKIESHH